MKICRIAVSCVPSWVCLAFVLVVAPPATADLGDKNVVVVLDASGSMNGTLQDGRAVKIDAAKSALREVMRQIPEDTNIGLLVFGAANVPEGWAYPLGPRNDSKLLAAIETPKAYGQTPLGAFIKMGADRLLAQRAAQFGYGSYQLLVVTDGEATDPELMDKFVPEVLARGIVIDVVGVSMAEDHALATTVHSYRRADDPSQLKTAIADVFAELSESGATAGADADAFDQLAGIPDATASAMLQALSTSGNHPIGEPPPTLTTGEASPEPQQQSEDGDASGVPAQSPDEQSGLTVEKLFIYSVAAIVIFLFIRSRIRAKSKSGSRGQDQSANRRIRRGRDERTNRHA